MKINCSTEEMSKGVQTIQSALSARTTLPILLNFLMETDGSKLKLVSTDLQMGVKRYIKAEIENEGSITIPAKKFSDILHTLPLDHEIFLSMDDDSKVLIKCGRSRFVINGTPKSEYPVLPEFSKSNSFSVGASDLADMIRMTIFAASSDETRYVLNGVFWAASGGTMEMVATDGRRLATVKRDILPKDKEFRAIIPTKILHELSRLLSNSEDESILIAITENQIAFQTKDTTMLSRLVEGSFPNYEQVIPIKKDIKLSIATKTLLVMTKQASLCSQDRGGSVKFTLKKGALHISASSQTLEFDDEIPVEYKGDDFIIAFNPQYVIDGLKAIGSEKVLMSLTTPVNPVLLEPEGEAQEGFKYVVMPMRV
ncbi:MAG: DNA polymerase III subunit beta [Elusimicrobiota bacterium]